MLHSLNWKKKGEARASLPNILHLPELDLMFYAQVPVPCIRLISWSSPTPELKPPSVTGFLIGAGTWCAAAANPRRKLLEHSRAGSDNPGRIPVCSAGLLSQPSGLPGCGVEILFGLCCWYI